MPRPILDESRIHAAIRNKVASHHQDIVNEVQAAVAANPVVVVGMSQNRLADVSDGLRQRHAGGRCR